ncbi:MAG: DUF4239 domain-containing protein [Chloroflexota bacterium]|nr:DUF4239 domain-containing protein [Chloroflexota bacterium]
MQTSPHVLVDGALFIFGSVAISLAVLWIVRRVVPHQTLTPHNEVSGFVYAAIGVIYAVLVGFAVITVWEEIRDAESNAIHEANAAADLYRLAGGLPEPTRQAVRDGVLAYATAVIDIEWDAMYDRSAPSDKAVAQMDALWQALSQVQPTTDTQTEFIGQSLQQLDELSEARRQRLIDSESGLPGLLWAALIAGAALTVLFPCVFGVENGVLHALIIATLAATLGLLLFLTYDLDNPYSGDVRLSPEGFTHLLEQFTASPPTP